MHQAVRYGPLLSVVLYVVFLKKNIAIGHKIASLQPLDGFQKIRRENAFKLLRDDKNVATHR